MSTNEKQALNELINFSLEKEITYNKQVPKPWLNYNDKIEEKRCKSFYKSFGEWQNDKEKFHKKNIYEEKNEKKNINNQKLKEKNSCYNNYNSYNSQKFQIKPKIKKNDGYLLKNAFKNDNKNENNNFSNKTTNNETQNIFKHYNNQAQRIFKQSINFQIKPSERSFNKKRNLSLNYIFYKNNQKSIRKQKTKYFELSKKTQVVNPKEIKYFRKKNSNENFAKNMNLIFENLPQIKNEKILSNENLFDMKFNNEDQSLKNKKKIFKKLSNFINIPKFEIHDNMVLAKKNLQKFIHQSEVNFNKKAQYGINKKIKERKYKNLKEYLNMKKELIIFPEKINKKKDFDNFSIKDKIKKLKSNSFDFINNSNILKKIPKLKNNYYKKKYYFENKFNTGDNKLISSFSLSRKK